MKHQARRGKSLPLSSSRPRPNQMNQLRRSAVYAASIATAGMSAWVIQRYDPQHRDVVKASCWQRGQTQGIFDNRHLSSTLGISEYLPRWLEHAGMEVTQEVMKHETVKNTLSQISSLLENLHVLQALEDPPALLFMAACISFTLTMATWRYSCRGNQYQDRIIVTGAALGIVTASRGRNFMVDSKGYLVWSTILALVFSALLHCILNLWPNPHNPDVLEKEDTQLKDLAGASEKDSDG